MALRPVIAFVFHDTNPAGLFLSIYMDITRCVESCQGVHMNVDEGFSNITPARTSLIPIQVSILETVVTGMEG